MLRLRKMNTFLSFINSPWALILAVTWQSARKHESVLPSDDKLRKLQP